MWSQGPHGYSWKSLFLTTFMVVLAHSFYYVTLLSCHYIDLRHAISSKMLIFLSVLCLWARFELCLLSVLERALSVGIVMWYRWFESHCSLHHTLPALKPAALNWVLKTRLQRKKEARTPLRNCVSSWGKMKKISIILIASRKKQML